MFRRVVTLPVFACAFIGWLSLESGAREKDPESKPPEQVKDKPASEKPAPKAPISDLLDLSLDTTQLQDPITFKNFLTYVHEKLAAGGKELPILVDKQAFALENPDVDIYEASIQFPVFLKKMKVGQMLRQALQQLPMHNATFLLRGGAVEITTAEMVSPERLLGYPILAKIHKRPLEDVLDELADLSGATILIDPRVGDKARTPVTAYFRNTIGLEGAVRLLAEMAELQADVREGVLFVTTKTKAEKPQQKSELKFDNRRLDLAVRELAEWSGATVLLDPAYAPPSRPVLYGRAKKAAAACDGQPQLPPPDPGLERKEMRVTATFKPDVSAATAARILAVQCGLTVAVLENVIYVTEPLTAEFLMRGIR